MNKPEKPFEREPDMLYDKLHAEAEMISDMPANVTMKMQHFAEMKKMIHKGLKMRVAHDEVMNIASAVLTALLFHKDASDEMVKTITEHLKTIRHHSKHVQVEFDQVNQKVTLAPRYNEN